MARTCTLKDIAAETGFAIPTISEVLNGKPNYCSAGSRQRILDAAQRLGYRKSFAYQLMLGQKTKTVAILISQPIMKEEEHIQNLMFLLTARLQQQDYSCYLCDMTDSATNNMTQVDDLIGRGVSCFIFLGAPFGVSEICTRIATSGLMHICYGSAIPARHILSDTRSGFVQLFRHFLAHGRRQFRVLTTSLGETPELWQHNTRLAALRELFPELPPEQLQKDYLMRINLPGFTSARQLDAMARIGYEATQQLLQSEPDIAAIAYHSDAYAIGGAACLHQHGRRIGADVMLAGFNNIFAVRNAPFPISSADHNIEQIAGGLLMELAGGSAPFSRNIAPTVHLR